MSELRVRSDLLQELTERCGTPLYVVDAQDIRRRYYTLDEALERYYPDHLICYSYKANSNLSVCRILRDLGAGATVASAGGVFIAERVGVDSRKTSFVGPSKSQSELRFAVERRVGMINAESVDEIQDIDSICKDGAYTPEVGIRVNLNIKVSTHAKLATGQLNHKFGVDEREALRAFRATERLSQVRISGLHSHIGSQILDVKPFRLQAERLARLLSMIKKRFGLNMGWVNLGGGIGVDYKKGADLPADQYAKTVSTVLRENCEAHGLPLPKLIVEPGRYIVGPSTVLVTRVNYVKRVGRRNWLLVDAGMNDFIRPALYGAAHQITCVAKKAGGSRGNYSIGGPICESSDVFAKAARLPRVERGDLLAIHDVGAYGICMASEYNSRPLPAMVVIDGDSVLLARRRRRFDELVAEEDAQEV